MVGTVTGGAGGKKTEANKIYLVQNSAYSIRMTKISKSLSNRPVNPRKAVVGVGSIVAVGGHSK